MKQVYKNIDVDSIKVEQDQKDESKINVTFNVNVIYEYLTKKK